MSTNKGGGRQAASASAASTSSSGGTGAFTAGAASQSKNEMKDNNSTHFLSEIADIMRGFGDCERPLRDSVVLVENILLEQMRGIFNRATEVANRRKGSTYPTQGDFEFLMRHHPVKINRMRKHLKDMKTFRRILQTQFGRQQTITEDTDGAESDEDSGMVIPDRFDEEKTRRLFRADRISQILTGPQYQQYNEARRTSFYCRHSEKLKLKFKEFLGLSYESRIPAICLNILAYLAHETIATVVDYAILTRLDSDNRETEPYSRVTSSGASYTMLHLCPEVVQGRGQDGMKPITVREITEGMRRHTQMSNMRGMGFYKNAFDQERRHTFLAL